MPPCGARVLQIYWRSPSAFESEIELWQPHWISSFQQYWCLQHSAVCSIPNCQSRMVLDGGWKLFRSQVCEVELPPTPLPVPTLQLRSLCGAKARRSCRTCATHACLAHCFASCAFRFDRPFLFRFLKNGTRLSHSHASGLKSNGFGYYLEGAFPAMPLLIVARRKKRQNPRTVPRHFCCFLPWLRDHRLPSRSCPCRVFELCRARSARARSCKPRSAKPRLRRWLPLSRSTRTASRASSSFLGHLD